MQIKGRQRPVAPTAALPGRTSAHSDDPLRRERPTSRHPAAWAAALRVTPTGLVPGVMLAKKSKPEHREPRSRNVPLPNGAV
jgi:hypothetical protein